MTNRRNSAQQELLDSFRRLSQAIRLKHKLNALSAEFSIENPPPYGHIRDLIDNYGLVPGGVARVLWHFGMIGDSTETGRLEPTSVLRDDTDDKMGEATDDHASMGEAEMWFREQDQGEQ